MNLVGRLKIDFSSPNRPKIANNLCNLEFTSDPKSLLIPEEQKYQ